MYLFNECLKDSELGINILLVENLIYFNIPHDINRKEVSSMAKTKFFPPERAIEIAWARTTQLSSNQAARVDAERAKEQMDDLLKKAEEKGSDKEKRYVNGVYSAIESTFRNLVTARNALDLNFTEVLKLREKRSENIQYNETFSSELQSLIPRLSEMTIGGVTGGVLLSAIVENWFPPSLKPYAMPLVLAFSAAATYIIHETLVKPWVRKKLEMEVIKLDYDRIMYYAQYVERVKASLKGLFNKVNRLHEHIFEDNYYKEKVDPDKFVNDVLVGMEPSMCDYVADCISPPKEVITSDLWSRCETGRDVEKCPHHPRQRP